MARSDHSGSTDARLPLKLTLAAVLMFGFGFALAPLYDVFCQITGINGKITRTGAIEGVVTIDNSRLIRVQLIGINNAGMPWVFAPEVSEIQVNPGEQRLTHFQARNPTLREMVARAVPSVAPSEAAQYVHKVNCFCFEEQLLAGQTSQQMPLVLMIDPQLPDHIRTITLSYTLFDISPQPTLEPLNKSAAVTYQAGSPDNDRVSPASVLPADKHRGRRLSL